MKNRITFYWRSYKAHVLPGTYDFEIVYELDVVYKISKNSIYVTWNPLDRLSERSVCLKIPKSQLKSR